MENVGKGKRKREQNESSERERWREREIEEEKKAEKEWGWENNAANEEGKEMADSMTDGGKSMTQHWQRGEEKTETQRYRNEIRLGKCLGEQVIRKGVISSKAR